MWHSVFVRCFLTLLLRITNSHMCLFFWSVPQVPFKVVVIAFILVVTSGFLSSASLAGVSPTSLSVLLWLLTWTRHFLYTKLPVPGYFLYLRPFFANPRDGCDVVKIPVDQQSEIPDQPVWRQQPLEAWITFNTPFSKDKGLLPPMAKWRCISPNDWS